MSTDTFLFRGDTDATKDHKHKDWIDIVVISEPIQRSGQSQFEPMDELGVEPVELEAAGDLICLPNGDCWMVEDGEM